MPSAEADTKDQPCEKPDERLTHLQGYMEKKIRNLDKRRNKLELYKVDLASGKKLDIDQANAVEAYDTVVSTLDLCREVVSQLKTVIKDKSVEIKNENKKRIELKVIHDQERLRLALRFQDILNQLRDEKVRDDFLTGRLGAVTLDEVKLQQLMDLQTAISPPTGENRSPNHTGVKDQLNTTADNFGNLLDGSNETFQDTTYKNMKMLLNTIANCPYPKQPKPKKELPPPQTAGPIKEMINGQNSNGMNVNPSNMYQQQPIDFNQGDIMQNGYPANPPISYNHMLPMEPNMPAQSSYYSQNHMAPLEIRDFMLSSNINFLQDSQVSPQQRAVYMGPAVVSFGTIQPESLMQLQEQQMVHQAPIVNLPVVQSNEPQLVYQAETAKEPQTHVEPPKLPSPEPVKTSWADETNDRWPNEINGESNVWNEKPESMTWSEDVDEKRNNFSRNRPSNRRTNYSNNYRGRGGFGGNYNNSNRGGNSYGSSNYRGRGNNNGYRPPRGNGSSYRGNGYRGYRGGYQNQQQRS